MMMSYGLLNTQHAIIDFSVPYEIHTIWLKSAVCLAPITTYYATYMRSNRSQTNSWF